MPRGGPFNQTAAGSGPDDVQHAGSGLLGAREGRVHTLISPLAALAEENAV